MTPAHSADEETVEAARFAGVGELAVPRPGQHMPLSGALAELEGLGPGVGAQAGRVLLIAGAGKSREQLSAELAAKGWSVDIADTAAGVQARMGGRRYRAVMVDWPGFEAGHRDGNPRREWLALARAAQRAGAKLIGLASGDAKLPDMKEQPVDSVRLSSAASTDGLADQFVAGRSEAMMRVMEQVRLVAPKDTTVLITGETGTGKERVSRAIHALSRRGRLPMVSMNCAGIPATLLEDEFFGHVKGAFTDAHQTRIGRFEQAHGGTLFLDEIGELPLELQPKLLRALQEREIHRIGALDPIRLDIRVIAATNVDLWRWVEDKRFREDLFYRINVFHIELPPLRERPEDIPLFAEYFLERFSRREGQGPKGLSPAAVRALMGRPWRGNIRELENAVEIAVIRSGTRREISERDVLEVRRSPEPAPRDPVGPSSGTERDFKTLVQHYERELITRALEQTGGNKNQAARLLRLKRTTLIEKLKRIADAAR